MRIEFRCLNCGHQLSAKEDRADDLVRCPYCGGLTATRQPSDGAGRPVEAPVSESEGMRPAEPPPVQEAPPLGGLLVVLAVLLMLVLLGGLVDLVQWFRLPVMLYDGASLPGMDIMFFMLGALSRIAVSGYLAYAVVRFFQRRRSAPSAVARALVIALVRLLVLMVLAFAIFGVVVETFGGAAAHPVWPPLVFDATLGTFFCLIVVAYLSKSKRVDRTFILK